MTLVPWDDDLNQGYATPYARPRDIEDASGWGAAFRLENPVVGAYMSMLRPQFDPDPNFDLERRLQETPDFQIDPDAFLSVESDAEFDYTIERIRREERDRQILEANGGAGIAQAMVSGMLSPTVFLPGGAVVRSVRAGTQLGRTALRGGAWALAGATIDEGILYTTQETRTGTEVLIGIGTGAVLGGLIGGAAGLLTPRAVRSFEVNMATGGSERAIQSYMGGSLSAARTPEEALIEESAGGILNTGLNSVNDFLSPVARNLNQTFSRTLSAMQAKINTGGMYLRGNVDGIASNAGGEIASLRQQHYYGTYEINRPRFGGRFGREGTGGDFAENWYSYIKETPVGQRMNQEEFLRAAGRVLSGGDSGGIKQVEQLATAYREKVFQPMLRAAVESGMKGFDEISEEFAANYFPRAWKRGLLEQDRVDLRLMLGEHFEEALFEKFHKQYTKLQEGLERDTEALRLLGLDAEGRKAELAQTEAEMARLPEAFPEVRDVAERIRELRANARGLRTDEAKAMRAEANRLADENKEALADFDKAEKALKNRFNVLSKTAAGFAERQAQVLRRIEAVEGQQLQTLRRAIEQARKLLDRLDRGETKIEADLERLQARLESAYKTFAKGEDKLDKMKELPEGFEHLVLSDPRSSEKISKLEDRQQLRAEALEDLIDQVNDLETTAVNDLRTAVFAQIENLEQATLRVNNKRALRLDRMKQRAQELSPERSAELQEGIRAKMRERRLSFMERMQTDRGAQIGARTDSSGERFLADDVDLAENINFKEEAQKIADDVIAAMLGDNRRSRGFGQLAERGVELARTLDIDEFKKWSNGRSFDEFLERNVDRVSRQYLRTMSADVELQRAFGSVNPLAKDAPLMKRMTAEYRQALDDIANDEKLSPEQKNKATTKLNDQWKQAQIDMDIQIQRLRYTRGVPDDPEAMGYRLGRFAMNLNVLRLMGGVVVSSLPDMGSVIMRHGMRTFTDGLIPMIRDFKSFKMSVKEAKLAGTALDVALHGRMAAMFDVLDEVEYGTKFERGVQALTNNFGMLSLMDHYNTAMQSFAGALVNGRMIRALEAVATGRGGPRDAATYLAANGIDAVTAGRMWAEITGGGGSRVNGVWLPNTIDWRDADLARAYRAALARQVQSEIVVPGTERPNWMDANTPARVIAQFRSFTFSSQFRIIQAGMQEARLGNYAPVAAGMMTSLAMGAVSYQLWAWANGEETSDDPAVWINQAVDRSGILGVLAEVKNVADDIPILRPYATLGSNIATDRQFANPSGAILGPSYSLGRDMQRLLTGALDDEPGLRESEENAMRRLIPGQNLSYAARFFDYLQEQFGEN
jgi:archaellum component FlaC